METQTETQPKVPKWYKLVDDGKPVKCSDCRKTGPCTDYVYVTVPGNPDIIIHTKCIGEKWLKNNKQGFPHKKRSAHRAWWLSTHKLKLVKG